MSVGSKALQMTATPTQLTVKRMVLHNAGLRPSTQRLGELGVDQNDCLEMCQTSFGGQESRDSAGIMLARRLEPTR